MSEYTNPVSSTSYTNLDFEQIFPELLDTTTQLTNKWDPSTSNESDPGVVLLKELAITGDKINYNTDKNVLETYPVSVTQDINARTLFKQLGYYMKWYRSAQTKVTLKWIGANSNLYYTIPVFTMVKDEDTNYIYSLLGLANSTSDKEVQVGDITLYQNQATPTLCFAMEGVATVYSYNGTSTITANMLDSNNRIYFPYKNVAQNGIFIQNVDDGVERYNFSTWKKVDNLLVQSLGNKFYEFGVSRDGSSCYIEFPEDAAALIESGIKIVYIVSSGESGTVSARTLTSFYSDLSINENTTLNSSNVTITNPVKSDLGYDPETISEAYKSYKRTIGTFNTLVTIRDYTEYTRNSGLVSNSFVCDRTNDVQVSYKVTHTNTEVTTFKTTVEQGAAGGDEYLMNAYNLKLYLLQFEDNITNLSDFEKTFLICTEAEMTQMKNYLENARCLAHDFIKIRNADLTLTASGDEYEPSSRMHFCFFKNVYPLNIRVSCISELTSTQRLEVFDSIVTTLRDNLNSSALEFGEAIDEVWLEDLLTACNSKIKNVSFDNIEYKTYAVLKVDDIYTDILVSDVDTSSTDTEKLSRACRDEIYAKSVLGGKTQHFIDDEEFDYNIDMKCDEPERKIIQIETRTNINIGTDSSTSAMTKLKTNEFIQVIVPSYDTIANFADNVKIEWKLNNNFVAGQNYTLTNGEYVALYYRETLDSDFNYHIYGAGYILCPQFTSTTTTQFINGGTYLHYVSTGTYFSGRTWETDTVEIAKITSGNASCLTADRSISLQQKSETILNDSSNNTDEYAYYWITNNVIDNKICRLFEKNTTELSRILEANEYFMYTNRQRSDYVILGEGTKITLSRSPSTDWDCATGLDYIKLIEDGMDALSEFWVSFTGTVDSNVKISCSNNMIYTISENNLVYAIGASLNNITREWKSIPTGVTSICYKDADDTVGAFNQISNLKNGQIRALLSLNVSPTTSQTIGTGQTVTIKNSLGTSKSYTSGAILTDSSVNYNGNGILSTLMYDIVADTWNTLSLLHYSFGTLTNFVKNDLGFVTTLLNGEPAGSASTTFKLPLGNYILSLTHYVDENDMYLHLDNEGTTPSTGSRIIPIGYADGNVKSAGVYFYDIAINANNQVLTLKWDAPQADDTVTLGNIYKYNENENAPSVDTSTDIARWKKVLVSLDYASQFDYCYQVPEAINISDPLAGKEFNNPNHIFNKFTICKLNFSKVNIRI